MVATDTVVGIVGAVLLVAVMAGVFVYEYNNPAEAEDTTPEGRMAAFEEKYDGLSANDDIDDDGIANYEDDDLDGDGTANENDTAEVAVTMESTQAIGQGTTRIAFYVGNGSVHVISTVDISLAVPNPLFAGNFIVELVRPDGTIADNQASSPGGPSTFTVQTQAEDEVPAGDWAVVIRPNQATTPAAADVLIEVHYPAPVAEGHGHIPER